MTKKKIKYERYLTFKGEFPEPDSFSGLIIGGGNSMLNYFDNTGNFSTGASLIEKTNKPILGICLGNQIIGRMYGADLEPLEEQGWTKIDIVKNDELLKDIPYTFNAWVKVVSYR